MLLRRKTVHVVHDFVEHIDDAVDALERLRDFHRRCHFFKLPHLNRRTQNDTSKNNSSGAQAAAGVLTPLAGPGERYRQSGKRGVVCGA
jgi:hypothetical protein